MSGKLKFVTEYELNASAKMLYPYLSTALGLDEWIADEVSMGQDGLFTFVWEGEAHVAKKATQKLNQFVKFEFLDDDVPGEPPSFIEFKLEENELTQTSFLKITDFSSIDDPEDLKELWHQLIDKLKERIGA